MSRGLTDPIPDPEEAKQSTDELDSIINELILGQNKLHDRLVDLERRLDHMAIPEESRHHQEHEAADRKFWKRGL